MIQNTVYNGGRYKTINQIDDINAKYLAKPWWEILFNTTMYNAAAECASRLGVSIYQSCRLIREMANDRKAMEAYKAFMQESSCCFMEGYISSRGVSHE